jgi:hypothetical protein
MRESERGGDFCTCGTADEIRCHQQLKAAVRWPEVEGRKIFGTELDIIIDSHYGKDVA